MKLTLRKTKIEISYGLVCVCALCVITGLHKELLPCAGAIVIHESGHIFLMSLLGGAPKRIKLSLFEISINDALRTKRSDKDNILIIFFGPAFNFICFIATFLLYLCGKDYFLPFSTANLSVGLFNLLPVASLDGGQLILILLQKFFPPDKSDRILTVLTVLILIPLSVAGFTVLFHSKYNFSLLFICAYLLLSLLFKNDSFI